MWPCVHLQQTQQPPPPLPPHSHSYNSFWPLQNGGPCIRKHADFFFVGVDLQLPLACCVIDHDKGRTSATVSSVGAVYRSAISPVSGGMSFVKLLRQATGAAAGVWDFGFANQTSGIGEGECVKASLPPIGVSRSLCGETPFYSPAIFCLYACRSFGLGKLLPTNGKSVVILTCGWFDNRNFLRCPPF